MAGGIGPDCLGRQFTHATPAGWTGVHMGTTNPYLVWRFDEVRTAPFDLALLAQFLGGQGSV